jgi:hypothetical protein
MIFAAYNPPAAHARAHETEALLLDKESACTAAAAEVAGVCCCMMIDVWLVEFDGDAELRVGLRRRRKAAAAAAAQMKVLLDKFKAWAQGGSGGGVGVEEVLKQQVEAAVEGYKHQLQVRSPACDLVAQVPSCQLQALQDDVRCSQEHTLQQQAGGV